MQPIVHERVDGDHRSAGRDPPLAIGVRAKHQVGECHGQELVGYAVDAAERLEQGLAHSRGAALMASTRIALSQSTVEPANKIVVADIPKKQEKTVCGLVEYAASEIMSGQRAFAKMLRMRARPS